MSIHNVMEGVMYDVVVCNPDYRYVIIRVAHRYQAKEKRERPACTGNTSFYQTG